MRDDVAGPCGSVLSEGLGPDAQVWTCFHCGEVCADADAARLHFGSSEHQQPGCQIDLAEYRRMEEVNRRHCEEDTELHRAMSRMECEHQQALRREEEAGYAKGLHDARREFGHRELAVDEDQQPARACIQPERAATHLGVPGGGLAEDFALHARPPALRLGPVHTKGRLAPGWPKALGEARRAARAGRLGQRRNAAQRLGVPRPAG